MDIFSILLWIITIIFLIVSLLKDKERTITSMKMGRNMMKNMIGEIFAVLFIIGLMITLIPPESINTFMGDSNVILSTIGSAFVGSVTLIPAFVAFPLAKSLLDRGANVVPLVAFLTTLTMVGVVTFPLEKREFGLKFALIRNILSFGFAVVIALVMGGVI
ncbi:permease [Alkalithermobacter paradoxus]|uniref:Putative permease n=1 Tax=Alkalithermobacter paradoxus TaxID=29349 RepID=A0A1V4IAA8_9FIRM|nr:putative permease [[Clostridium] thermoalcaliphilum]